MSRNIIVAFDRMERAQAIDLCRKLSRSPYFWGPKLSGLLLKSELNSTVARFLEFGHVFGDLKFHDIPTTVADEAEAFARAGISLFTMHAAGGPEMVRAGVMAFNAYKRPDAIGGLCVTLLTSIDQGNCHRIYGSDPLPHVREMANIASEAEAWGVVCSPQEVGALSTTPKHRSLKFVTPALRPLGSNPGDQMRFDTPENAFRNGATLGVVGRPVTEAKDPLAALNAIGESIASCT